MRRVFLFTLLALAAWPTAAAAQELLPGFFSTWNAPAAASRARPEALEQWAGGDAAVVREYGALAAERRAYARGTESVTITLYQMRDSSGAYGAYTYLRTAPMASGEASPYSSFSRERALLVVGNLLLDVTGNDLPRQAGDLKTLAATLAAKADKTPYPTIGRHLPAHGLVSNSERYLLGPLALQRLLPLGNGDWIGFSDGAEATLARYRINGKEVTLLLAAYPTPQAAARKLEELGRWFPLNPEQDVLAGSPAPIFARRQGSLLKLVAHSMSTRAANALLDQIHYETQVTWNEPRHKLTDPSIAQILVGTIMGTGIILLFALVAGIGFGGIRILVKYFFPGKVFDRASHVEILQLGLSSKPIEAKDFY
ncbi:MAG: hypothetical protein HY237_04020 [Acidobacteria bacterium]|nr:hypothetical protein [Acidobacteriota bacterium]